MANPLLSPLPEPALSIAQQVAGLCAIRDNYMADLYLDAIPDATGKRTQPDYSLDGRSVSRNAWRQHLTDEIAALNKQITMLQPYQFKTIAG